MLLRGDNIQNRSQAGGESRRFFQADGKRLATMSGNGEYGGAAFASWFFPSVFLDLTFWCSLFCQGWAHCSHFKKKYALCGVHSPVPPLLDQSHMKGPTLDLTGGSFRATLHFPDPLRWTLWLGRKAKVTLSTRWQSKGTQGHNLVLWVAGGQFDPSINWPGLLSCASTWRCLKRRISGFSKSVSKANPSQGHFLSLESRQAWSLPFAFWELPGGIQHMRSPYRPLLRPSLCSQPSPPTWKSIPHFPSSLWQVNKGNAP